MDNAKKVFETIKSSLSSIYDEREAASIAFELLEKAYGVSRENVVAQSPVSSLPGIENNIEKLRQQVPVQHITGLADFYGRSFQVGPEVLIPRPETEELVQLIISEFRGKSPRFLDIGTGSGCIAISLVLEMGNTVGMATDISREALSLAGTNAKLHAVEIELIQNNIINEPLPGLENLDFIVSNPPYIPKTDAKRMKANVLDHEPGQALFVEDDDPLLFYRVISEKAFHRLNPNGRLFFEIHEDFGMEVARLLDEKYTEIKVQQDLNGKDRMVSATRKF